MQHNLLAEEWLKVRPLLAAGEAEVPGAERQVRLWALVLDARSIPCQIVHVGRDWQLLVPASFVESANEELRLFVQENRNWPPPLPAARQLAENTLSTLSVLFLLASFHNITLLDMPLFGHPHPDWQAIGAARAAAIRAGEWWRLITALTLHSDWLHLLSNLSFGGFLVYFLCRDLGSGLAWSLLLGAGMLGNLVNAWVQPAMHSSVGASTVVFGAVGILASLSLVRYRHQLQRRWGLPVAAALALLALLGSEGERTDLGAHLFGLLYGLCLGILAEYLTGRYGRPGRVLNALLIIADMILVVGAWWLAMRTT